MEAILLLANSAEVYNGNMVSALGLGWSITGTPTPAASVVVMMKVPWDQTNQRHKLHLDLVDGDGQPFTPPGAPQPIMISGHFEAGRPAGLPPGTPIDQSLVLNLPVGLPLTAGSTYQWRLHIDDEIVTTRSFYVHPSRSAQPVPPQQ